MKKTILITMMVALLVGTCAFAAWADPGTGPGHFGKEGRMGIFRDLNLTLDQQQKIMTIRQDFEKDTLTIRNDMQKKNSELRQLWKANPLDQTAIDSKTKEINTIKIQMITKMRVMREKMKAVLTADQLKKINDFKQNHQFGPGGMGKRGGCWG